MHQPEGLEATAGDVGADMGGYGGHGIFPGGADLVPKRWAWAQSGVKNPSAPSTNEGENFPGPLVPFPVRPN
ncbi:hypothetical protein GCM10007890_01720 [Methylobacterium tardum]|uniref:Uncharacterized protein n=1 Tax=Methylobacterium tardum TaxID=374432 RepID=A0AA37TA74_9HYPH|nr:hypothetical protein GCM10007890_01720 [Methylobacterium tardum]